MRLLDNRRAVFGLIALVNLALLGVGLYLQHVEGLEPCPLCVLQRYAFVLVAILAIVAALLPGRGAAGAAVGWLAVLATAAGAATSTWHSWLQRHPPKIVSCGADFDYLISSLPLTDALPKIFRGSGDCTVIDWTFLGLSIPNWSLVWFLIFLVLAVVALLRPAGR